MLRTDDVKGAKDSDTLVVLGSGPSINDLKYDFWERCQQCDTLAINWWLYHNFVPKFWMFNLQWNDKKQLKIWKDRLSGNVDYEKVIWMCARQKNAVKYHNAFNSCIRGLFSKESRFYFYEKAHYIDWIHDLAQIFEDCRGRIDRYFVPAKCTDTLICAITFGVQMGYKKIILAGIDLNDSFYFWTNFKDEVHRHTNNKGLGKSICMTQQDWVPEISVDNAVKAINDFVLKPDGIELYVASRKSILYPDITYTNLAMELPKQILVPTLYKADFAVDLITEEQVKEKKSSETLIILGGGTSINDLHDNFWQFAAQHDTLAINWWIYHSFVPDFWMIESSWKLRERHVWDKQMQLKANLYKDVIWFHHKPHRETLPSMLSITEQEITDVFQKVIFARFPQHSRFFMYNRREYAEWPRRLHELFQGSRSDLIDYFLPTDMTGTLSCAVTFGYKMGYTRIVLAGIDLNSPFYFWSHKKGWYHRRVDDGYIFGKKNHTTEERIGVKDRPISRVIMDIHDCVLVPEGITMQVASMKSLLHPQLTYFDINKE